MQVKIQGLLKLRSAAAVDAALQAFDRQAYPEFFTADVWEPAGAFLRCQTEFELASDCDVTSAIRAIVGCANDGLVEVLVSGEAEAWRFTRSKRAKSAVSEAIPEPEFGKAVGALMQEWSEPLAKAHAAETKKAARAAKTAKKSSTVVDLGGAARAVISLADGHFAALVRSEVVVFSADGVVSSRYDLRLPNDHHYSFQPRGLTELLDGRLAVAGDYSNVMRVLDRTRPTVTELEFGREVHMETVLPVPGGFVRREDLSLVLGDEVISLDGSTDDSDYGRAALRWGDRFVITMGEKNLVYDREGKLLFDTQGGTATVVGGRLYTSWEGTYGCTEPDGTFVMTEIPSSGTLVPVGEALLHASGSARRFDADGNLVWSAPGIYDRANSGPPIVLCDSVIVMTPAAYPPSARLVVVDFDRGKAMGEVSGKGELEHTYRVNEDTVIGLAHGAQGKKLHVFRDLRGAPKYEALGGHTKAISGVAIRENVVATWSEDGTTRLFGLG